MKTSLLKSFSDADLVIAFQEKKEGIYFGELYQRYYKKVFYQCISFTKDRDDAYDLTQEIFIKIGEKMLALKDANYFSFWLYRTTRNACIDYTRQKKHHMPIDENFDAVDASVESMEFALEKEAQLNLLEEVLSATDEETRELLKLKYFEHLSVKDLEERYDISTSAVKMRLARARAKVNREFIAA